MFAQLIKYSQNQVNIFHQQYHVHPTFRQVYCRRDTVCSHGNPTAANRLVVNIVLLTGLFIYAVWFI